MNSPVSSGRIDELPRIVDQLRRAFEGDAWHGPFVLEALTGVNAKMAAAKPIPTAHSIWEIVEHIGAWDDAIRQRLNGRALQLSPEQDWPAISATNDAAWIESLDTLKKRHSDLCSAISAMPEQRLLATVPGKDYDFYHMLPWGSATCDIPRGPNCAAQEKLAAGSTNLTPTIFDFRNRLWELRPTEDAIIRTCSCATPDESH